LARLVEPPREAVVRDELLRPAVVREELLRLDVLRVEDRRAELPVADLASFFWA
jgi:hypothetical protein